MLVVTSDLVCRRQSFFFFFFFFSLFAGAEGSSSSSSSSATSVSITSVSFSSSSPVLFLLGVTLWTSSSSSSSASAYFSFSVDSSSFSLVKATHLSSSWCGSPRRGFLRRGRRTRPFLLQRSRARASVVLLAVVRADDVGFFGVVVFRDDDFGVDLFDDDGVVVVCRDDRRVGVAMCFRSSSCLLSLSVCVLCVPFACARPLANTAATLEGGECNNAREKRTDKFFVRFFFFF